MGENKNLWFYSQTSRPRAVVLLAHGLNLKPQRMDSLAHFLKDAGCDCLRLSLSGHDKNRDEFKHASCGRWEREFRCAHSEAYTRASEISSPLFFLGYSMGASLGLELMNVSSAPVAFSKMVLLAPALSIRPMRGLVKLLNIFGPGFFLPSASPKDYRAQDGTPIAAYNTLFAMIKKIRRHGLARCRVPTLVFAEPKDELVSFMGLQKLIAREGLESCWNLRVIQKEPRTKGGAERIHHLILDEESLGADLWRRMQAEIAEHLFS